MSAAPPSLVLGTAGHIDHGKTALVRALTGVDTDRLPEEKARGITLDLGFAPLELAPGLRVGVVDVPGHEGLVRTMVAGATGIDLVLLVVAADEGVMPQTREHLAICDLLGLCRGAVALTRCDRADADVVALARAEIGELLAGTGLAALPVVPTSATTGEGLSVLREALAAQAGDCEARTARTGPPRLSVDRVFSVRGFGTVATGTLVGSALRTGDALQVHPGEARARVRGLQCFGEPTDAVAGGARCAVNLQGVDPHHLARGQVLAPPGALSPTRTFDAALTWLADAPPLAEGAPTSVELLVGTAERRARVAPIGGALAPGASGLARVHVDGEPLALLPGERFVLRGFARTAGGGATLAGGRVLDVAPPRRRRSDPLLRRELEALAHAGPEDAVALRVARAGFAGAAQDALARETGLGGAELEAALGGAEARGGIHRAATARWVGGEALDALQERLSEALDAFHDREPMRPGMPRGELRGALPANTAPGAFELALARLAAADRIRVEEHEVRAADFVPRLTQRQEALAARLRADAMIAGLEPPTPREQAAGLDVDEAELRDVLAHLERDGSLVRAPGDLWFDRGAVDALRERVVAHLREHGSLDTAAYKALIGTTRKFAVPLMELFDGEHLTIRRGEARTLRRRA